jgi:hypothetical protein
MSPEGTAYDMPFLLLICSAHFLDNACILTSCHSVLSRFIVRSNDNLGG